ncbi:MAG: ABC transporter ATP-binding protein [Clostridia bacterium]|nr:ABC transporter ATP-binding protein [Clostridia bacterium]
MSLIEVKNLSAYYENKEIFSNLNFSVYEGDYLCIIGENGSGKTTLMRLLLGFKVKKSGSIILRGVTRKEIGYLPQKTETQRDFPASVNEIIMSGFSSKSFFGIRYSKAQKEKALKNMELLEIGELKNRSFKELSGGQQQKVLLCRSLCATSKAILMDEPVTGLDSASREEFYALIRKLNLSGIAVIMISHDINKALVEGKNILHISENGYFYGKTIDYLESGFGGAK